MVTSLMAMLRRLWPRTRQGLVVGVLVAAGLLLIWAGNWFAAARLRLNDAYFVPENTSDTIVLVALDDASLNAYGRAPVYWPRTLYADLVQRLNEAQARVIAFDVLFAEPAEGDTAFAAALSAARSSETRTRSVLTVAGARPFLTDDPAEHVLHFENMLRPIPALYDSADYVGAVNAYLDSDNILRRQPSLIEMQDERLLAFSLATYLAYLRIPAGAASDLLTVDGDWLTVVTPEHQLPIDDNGFWRPYFFGPPANDSGSVFPVVSFQDVLNGQVPAALFADKIVLVGSMNSIGMTDQYLVPSTQHGQRMAGVEIYAHAIETLIQNNAIVEQPRWAEALTFIVLTLFASALYSHLRWYWMLLAAAALTAGWILLAFMVFATQVMLLNLFHPVLALTSTAVVHLGIQISREFNRRRRTESLLASVVAVTSQQLALAPIVHRIASDLTRLLQTNEVEIWLRRSEQEALQVAWPIPDETGPPAGTHIDRVHRADTTQTVVAGTGSVAVPVLWQGRTLAVFAAAVPRLASQRAVRRIQTLARQIAPGLENALLYAEIDRQKALLEAVIAGSPAGIMVVDNRLRVQRCNQALRAMLGVTEEQGTDEALDDVFARSGLIQDTRKRLAASFLSGQAFREELKYGGQTFVLDAAPLSVGWVVIVNDVSAMAELSALKTRMIRMASHDLKNPLQIVLGFAQLLEMQTNLDEATLKRIGAIAQSGEEMLNIINDILDMEQLRSGQIEYAELDMVALIWSVIEQHQPDMDQRQQHFAAEIADDLPGVRGDARQITQVITNLLGNAVKYTPDEGRITLRLFQPEAAVIRLEIEDTGYGISEEAQSQLFQEFFRAKTRGTEDIPGTGLGLSLVKWIVESHQGRVWVHSTEQVGSTFFVELPCI